MRSLVIFLLLFGIKGNLLAQKDQPVFGVIDQADLELKDCEFDKGAEAFKLIDWEKTEYQRGRKIFRTVSNYRVRIKILNEKGLSYADIKLPFYSRDNIEKLDDIEGYTYNLDGGGKIVTAKLDKNFIFRKNTDKRHSLISFAFPEVRPGSVVEYRYTVTRESYSHLDDWYFQDNIPIRFSGYELRVPVFLKFLIDPHVSMKLDISESTGEESIRLDDETYSYAIISKKYALKNVPAIRKEPYMSTFKDYLQRISFELIRIEVPNEVQGEPEKPLIKFCEELMHDDDFGKELSKNVIADIYLDRQVEAAVSTQQKITLVYDYVRKQVLEIESNSIFTKLGVKDAWEKKSGNASDINFILINTLKYYKLDVYPLLASTRDNGLVNTMYPFIGQFNRVLAYVKDGTDYFVLNAADKYNPARLIPYDVNNTECLLLDGANTRWLIISKPEQQIRNEVIINAEIDAKGILSGEATVKSFDYEKTPRCKAWKEDKEAYKLHRLVPVLPGMKIDSVEVMNEDIDALPLLQNLKFSATLNKTGDYFYFNTNLFSGLDHNDFMADTRSTDIDFGNKQYYDVDGFFAIPDGYQLDAMPKKITMITPDTGIVFKRSVKLEDGMLNIHISLEYRNTFYLANQYQEFKEFSKKLFTLLNEQIVLKKQ